MDRLGPAATRGQLEGFAKLSGWTIEVGPLNRLTKNVKPRFDAAMDRVFSSGPFSTSDDLGPVFHAALANLALGALMTGHVSRASDADLIFQLTLDVQKDRGGVLFQADDGGLLPLFQALSELGADPASVLAPVTQWQEMLREGQNFLTRPATFATSSQG